MKQAAQQIPVFVINGFLEAGKTQFMKFTMQQDYFATEGMTLLLVCEEGEEEYSEEFLRSHRTEAVYIRQPEEINPQRLRILHEQYQPERVLIEWNGLWLQDDLVLPEEWFLNQMVSIFDTSTLDLYLKNMKAFIGPMLRRTELIICNRADDMEEDVLAKYHLNFRALNKDTEIVFEGKDGEIRGDFSIELPYSLEDKIVRIENKDFGIFYVDSMERPEKYEGKTFEFVAQVLKPPHDPFGDVFVPVRKVMTCCEDDIQYLGHVCHYKGAVHFKNRDWVKVTASLHYEYHEAYRQKGPVFHAKELVHTGAVKEIVTFG